MGNIDPDVAVIVEELRKEIAELRASIPAQTDAAGHRFFARLHTVLADTPPERHAEIYDSLLVN